MKRFDEFEQQTRRSYRLVIVIIAMVVLVSVGAIYVFNDPDLSYFKNSGQKSESAEAPIDADGFNRIENGIHVRTGLIDAPGLMATVNNCTTCHSAKLIIQNRMSKERWISAIRWMQKTQNLWDLGDNEEIIVDYLVTNYPPKKVGRRAVLTDVEWYKLKD